MSTNDLRIPGPRAGAHPVVLERRVRDLAYLALAGLISAALALAIAVAVPKPNLLYVPVGVAGVLGVVYLMVSPRLEVSVGLLVFYLGCLNGPLKLIIAAGVFSSGVQDVAMLAICAGLLVRLALQRERVRLPALSGWVIAFVLVVMIEAFNPKTAGLLKVIGGFRQQLQWVPFFFFGYLVMRSKDRFRNAFLLLGVIARANGIVATVQTQLSPAQIATWGPGYKLLTEINTYVGGGVTRLRPLGLGGDSGFGGGVAVIALPGTLALLTIMRRRRWLVIVLCLGAIVAAATSLGRLQVGGTVVAALSFAFLAVRSGGEVGRPVRVMIGIVAIVIPLGILFVSAVGGSVFSRYESLATPESAVSTATGYKVSSLKQVPHEIASAPFGFGLGVAGSVSGFGGKVEELLEGHNVTSETQPNFLVKELGLLGLLVWYGLLGRVILLAVRRLREIQDPELRISLAATMAPLIAILAMSYDGPVSASNVLGAYFWFAVGVAGYWLVGPGRASARLAAGGPPLTRSRATPATT
jgi:hypothetical protein